MLRWRREFKMPNGEEIPLIITAKDLLGDHGARIETLVKYCEECQAYRPLIDFLVHGGWRTFEGDRYWILEGDDEQLHRCYRHDGVWPEIVVPVPGTKERFFMRLRNLRDEQGRLLNLYDPKAGLWRALHHVGIRICRDRTGYPKEIRLQPYKDRGTDRDGNRYGDDAATGSEVAGGEA